MSIKHGQAVQDAQLEQAKLVDVSGLMHRQEAATVVKDTVCCWGCMVEGLASVRLSSPLPADLVYVLESLSRSEGC